MSKTDREKLENLYGQAKKMHLSKFNFNGKFITFDTAKKLLKKK